MVSVNDNNALLIYRVGPVYCCSSTKNVVAIHMPSALNHPPGTDAAHPGVFKHGSKIVRVSDLRFQFGINQDDWQQPGRQVITDLDGAYIAFWVDEIIDVIRFPQTGWTDLPAQLPRGVFSRTLKLDKHIHLYAEFEKIRTLHGGGYLQRYITSLEQSTPGIQAQADARTKPVPDRLSMANKVQETARVIKSKDTVHARPSAGPELDVKPVSLNKAKTSSQGRIKNSKKGQAANIVAGRKTINPGNARKQTALKAKAYTQQSSARTQSVAAESAAKRYHHTGKVKPVKTGATIKTPVPAPAASQDRPIVQNREASTGVAGFLFLLTVLCMTGVAGYYLLLHKSDPTIEERYTYVSPSTVADNTSAIVDESDYYDPGDDGDAADIQLSGTPEAPVISAPVSGAVAASESEEHTDLLVASTIAVAQSHPQSGYAVSDALANNKTGSKVEESLLESESTEITSGQDQDVNVSSVTEKSADKIADDGSPAGEQLVEKVSGLITQDDIVDKDGDIARQESAAQQAGIVTSPVEDDINRREVEQDSAVVPVTQQSAAAHVLGEITGDGQVAKEKSATSAQENSVKDTADAEHSVPPSQVNGINNPVGDNNKHAEAVQDTAVAASTDQPALAPVNNEIMKIGQAVIQESGAGAQENIVINAAADTGLYIIPLQADAIIDFTEEHTTQLEKRQGAEVVLVEEQPLPQMNLDENTTAQQATADVSGLSMQVQTVDKDVAVEEGNGSNGQNMAQLDNAEAPDVGHVAEFAADADQSATQVYKAEITRDAHGITIVLNTPAQITAIIDNAADTEKDADTSADMAAQQNTASTAALGDDMGEQVTQQGANVAAPAHQPGVLLEKPAATVDEQPTSQVLDASGQQKSVNKDIADNEKSAIDDAEISTSQQADSASDSSMRITNEVKVLQESDSGSKTDPSVLQSGKYENTETVQADKKGVERRAQENVSGDNAIATEKNANTVEVESSHQSNIESVAQAQIASDVKTRQDGAVVTMMAQSVNQKPVGETTEVAQAVIEVLDNAAREKDEAVKTQSESAIKPKKHEVVHVVVKGDTLWHIAERYVHNPFLYPQLARLSNIKNPDLIYPGDRVRIIHYIDE